MRTNDQKMDSSPGMTTRPTSTLRRRLVASLVRVGTPPSVRSRASCPANGCGCQAVGRWVCSPKRGVTLVDQAICRVAVHPQVWSRIVILLMIAVRALAPTNPRDSSGSERSSRTLGCVCVPPLAEMSEDSLSANLHIVHHRSLLFDHHPLLSSKAGSPLFDDRSP